MKALQVVMVVVLIRVARGIWQKKGRGGGAIIPGTSFQDRFLNNDRKPQSNTNAGGRLSFVQDLLMMPSGIGDYLNVRTIQLQVILQKQILMKMERLQFLLNFQQVVLNRGFRPGLSGRVNGGYSFDGGGGGGGAGAEGGSGAEGTGIGAGGGGGSGYVTLVKLLF